MDENVINFELLEVILTQIDTVWTRYLLLSVILKLFPTIDGAVLVFLPGMGDIQALYSQLMLNDRLADESQAFDHLFFGLILVVFGDSHAFCS